MTGLTIDRINGLSGNLAAKAPVLAATTGPITLSGLQTIDGIAVPAGGRVLVKNQVDTTQNGWYDASTSSWSRCLDADGNSDLVAGTLCLAAGGAQAGVVFRLVCATTSVLPGTSAISFVASLSLTAISAFMLTLLDDTDAATARATLGAAGLGANTFTDDQTIGVGKVLNFEGATDNGFETTLTVADPTADRTITLPNVSLTVAGIDTPQTFTAQQTPMKGTLTDGATIDWNGNTNGQSVKVTTGAARTFNAPTNIIEDNLYVLRLTTGGFTPAWNAAYKWGTAPSSLESATYVFTFIGGPTSTLIPTGPGYKTGA